MNLVKNYLSLFCLAIMIAAGCKKDNPPPPPTAPVVATAALSNITTSSATAGGSIVSDGRDTITQVGIVWSQSNATPTIVDSVITGVSSNGTFTVNITGLDFDTVYYIRAFATNSAGTGYGDVVTLNTTNDTNKVRFTYNDEEVVYGIIISPTTGRKWLDRNLGAQQVATALDDYQAYGDLFQWGRPVDGHQLINWTSSTAGTPVNGTTAMRATSDNPGHSNFITITDYPSDWRDDDNMNRWAANPQGPCPAGWHVPSGPEWAAELDDDGAGGGTPGGITEANSGYDKLKLTVAGFREYDGQFANYTGVAPGKSGNYWATSIPNPSSDVDPASLGIIRFGLPGGVKPKASMTANFKVQALSVRCIKD